MRGGHTTGARPARGAYCGWRLPLALAVTAGMSSATAGEWRFEPTLDLSEVYSDNITLAPAGDEQDEFVTEVSPGFSLSGQGGRASLNMRYRLQNLFLASEASVGSHHQLSAQGNVEVARELFFVDVRSSISQQVIDPNISQPLDNINVGNRADVVTYGVSPYLKLRLGNYVDGEVRYAIDRVENESDSSISDAETTRYSAQLASGSNFSRLVWGANFRREDMQRNSAPDSLRESASASARYRLHQTFNVLAHAGYENNDIATTRDFENGGYWSAGGEWLPSRHFTLSATTGENNWDADVTIRPTMRTQLHAGFRDRSVGLTPGGTWNADFTHYTRRSTWRLDYFEETTNIQQLQITDQQFFLLVGADGNLVVDPATGQPVVFVRNVFGLTDQEFVRKRFQGSVNWRSGKSDFALSAFNEQRDFLLDAEAEDVVGGSASWTWRLMPRTSSVTAGGWQRRNPAATDAADDLYHVSLGLIRTISERISSAVEVRHTVRDSASNLGNSYEENRVTAELHMRF